MSPTDIALGVFGGLGLFIFGMKLMSEGLQKAAGDKLRRMIELLTFNRYVALVTGVVITMLVQSSSTTTVMVVGFANAGLMTLNQAIGTILGARIGTTVTAQIIAFRITDAALPLIGVGVILAFFLRRRLHRNIGQAVLGFGLLFFGLSIMGDRLGELRDNAAFIDLLATFGQYRLLGLLAGALFTALIQSSSASTGVIIVLGSQGILELDAALALALGTCVGTTVTAQLARIGTNVTARRVAAAHAFFNTLGALIFVWFLTPISGMVELTSSDIARQIAWGHTFFAVASTLIYLPLVPLFVRLIVRLVPGQEDEVQAGPQYLDRRLLRTPTMAIGAARKEIERMAVIAAGMVDESMKMLNSKNASLLDKVERKEDVVDELESEIAVYMAEISQQNISSTQGRELANYYHAINDIERIGDHAHNIAQLLEEKIEKNFPFSSEAIDELQKMYFLTREVTKKAVTAFVNNDHELAREIIKDDVAIDRMEKQLRNNHIRRVNCGQCFPPSGVIFLDIITNLERIGDHDTNIAQVVLGEF